MKQNGFFAEVIKTSKINVDETSHGLPPHNGAYKEFKVADYFCPEEWSNDGVFIPVKEGDPLWFNFQGNDECAILCAVQRINPVTGKPADLEEGLTKDPAQNYLRMPEQLWLDGYAKEGKVYQFVVTKAGIGLAVNEYVLPKHMQDSHAIGFAFFGPKNPKPVYRPVTTINIGGWKSGGWMQSNSNPVWKSSTHGSTTMGDISDNLCSSGEDNVMRGFTHNAVDSVENEPQVFCNSIHEANAVEPSESRTKFISTVDILAEQEAKLNELDKASMGAGGRITQSIVTDENTIEYYHEKRSALLTIYFALPEMYDAIMEKGLRQDASNKEKYKTSGHIGGVAVPLIHNQQY